MEPKTVALKGIGGKYARLGRLGAGLFDWYDILWDGTSSSDSRYHWILTKPDNLFALKPADGSDVYFGADNTQFSADLTKQFYGKPGPAGGRGPYESPVVYEGTKMGELLALVEYNNDGQSPWPSASWSVEVIS